MRTQIGLVAGVVCVGGWVGLASSSASADGTTTVLTVTGEMIPGTSTSATPFGAPVLNDAGQAAFVVAQIVGPGTGSVGVFHDSVAGPLISIAQSGEIPTGSTGTLDTSYLSTQINSSGEVLFSGRFFGTVDRLNVEGIPGTSLTTLTEDGTTPEPTGNGTFSSTTRDINYSDAGHVSFTAALSGVTGGAGTQGLYRINPDGAIVELARQGQAVPGGDGTFERFFSFNGQQVESTSINASGLVVFRGEIEGTAGGPGFRDTAVYTSDGTTLTEIVRDRDETGIPDTQFNDVNFVPAINDAGLVAFEIGLTGSGVTSTDNGAIYRSDGTTHTQIVRRGDAAPEGNGTFTQLLGTTVNLGGGGHVTFVADVTGSTGGNDDNRGLYISDGTTLTNLAREGDTVPGGNGTFSQFGNQPVVNDDGQAAFLTFLLGTTGGAADNEAIYFYDPTDGLEEVVRRGDTLSGGTITDLNFAQNSQRNTPSAQSGLNNENQLAFNFTLDNGTRGIALWDFEATVAIVTGDYNGDGFVSQSDLDLVLLNWGDAVAPAGFVEAALVGGGPFDGLMGQNELDGVLLNWGNGTSPGSQAIPEPGTAGVVLLTGALALRRRRR